MKNIDACPGTLAIGYKGYSPSCLKTLFNGRKVSCILEFDYDANSIELADAINHISISGVQEKD